MCVNINMYTYNAIRKKQIYKPWPSQSIALWTNVGQQTPPTDENVS